MKVTFIDAGGDPGTWDGCLWESRDGKMAHWLNRQLLPEGGRHDSIVDRARKLLTIYGDVPRAFEIVDTTGLPLEDIGEDVIFGEEELEAGDEGAQSGGYDGTTETGPERSALTAAEEHLRGGLCADGETDGEDDWERPEREWEALAKWAGESGLILTGPGPARPGGREHDVRYDEATGRWVKFTKPALAGYTVDWRDDGEPFLRNARPAEYLARLRRQNTLFEDRIELAGLWREGAAWRIVTTQPNVQGERATMEQIREGMSAEGLVRLRWNGIGYKDSESWRLGRMAVWDVHPANVVLTEAGLIVPVDVIITPLPEGFPPCHFHP